jgi:hypothetical protein
LPLPCQILAYQVALLINNTAKFAIDGRVYGTANQFIAFTNLVFDILRSEFDLSNSVFDTSNQIMTATNSVFDIPDQFIAFVCQVV